MPDAVIEKAQPKALQEPSVYLTRSVFRFHDPTGLSPDQWRLIAREPVNRSAQRFIIRELSALSWQITSDRRDDPRVDDYTRRWEEIWEDGQGFHAWVSRMIEDVTSLPFGAASEVGYKSQDLDWCQHVDAATLLPTYEKATPYVQVNPDDWTQRVYFRRGQLRRLRVNPRTEIRFKEYQISPTEDAFKEIEALSKIYLYYMQELTDTPPMGILDVMDWTLDRAEEWAKNFREMIEGVDPIKIPILFDHTGQAQFIQFGRSPQDMNVVEQFKRFVEILLSKYGLSIGDLRLFEHDSTKAGERVSQLVTERSGIGFWAALIASYINRLLPEGLSFEFKQPRPERELVVANRKAVQLGMLQAAVGAKALISVEDAVEEARALELFTTEVKAVDQPSPLFQTPPNGGPPELPGGETEEERDQLAEQDLEKALLGVGDLDFGELSRAVEKALGPRWQYPTLPASERLEAVFQRAFEGSARAIEEGNVTEVIELVERTLEPFHQADEIESKTTITDAAESRLHLAFTQLFDQLFLFGYIDRETRIRASSVIGEWLPQISEALLDAIENNREIHPPELMILAKSLVETVKGGPGSGHWGHTGRKGRGSTSRRAGGRVQAGITSYKEGEHEDIRQIRGQMRQFAAKLNAIEGVRNVSVEEGTGAWAGGSEPTWVTRYEVVTEEGGRRALSLLAETGKRYNQDGVLVMQFVGSKHPNAQPIDQLSFGTKLNQRRVSIINEHLAAEKVPGWTWSKDANGFSVVQIASVPQWDWTADRHTRAINIAADRLSSIGIKFGRRTNYIDPIAMDQSNYDDYIIK